MTDIEEIKKYIDFLSETDIEVLEITLPQGEKIHLKRNKSVVTVVPRHEEKQNLKQKISQQESSEDKNEFVIISPMVGKLLLSISKDHPPFVVEGTEVKQGQKVAIIETMKIFRDVISPKNGVVKKILVEDGKYVEYGQPLIVLELKE